MHPVLFQIGKFPIASYGALIVLGMVSGLWLAARLARRRGLRPEFFYDLAFVLLISGFIGARLFFIIIESDYFWQNPREVLFARQGFVFQGGFITALIAGILFSRWKKVPLLEGADIVAPALVLAHGFGRIGCFFAGCCYGFACPPGDAHHSMFCKVAVQYPLVKDGDKINELFNFAWQEHLRQGLIPPDAAAPLPIIPVQLFETAGNFLICLVLLWQWRRRSFSGQTFALYMILYGVLRFCLEFLRGDTGRGLYFNGLISTAQIICAFTVLGGLALWWFRHDKGFQLIPVLEEHVPEKKTVPKTTKSSHRQKPSANP